MSAGVELEAAVSNSIDSPVATDDAPAEYPTTTNGATDDAPEKKEHEESHGGHHGHGDPADHVKDAVPWKIHVYVAQYPCLSCLFMCWWFVLCGILVAVIPGVFSGIETAVPFYIRDNTATELKDALWAGMLDADWEKSDSGATERQQETTADVNLRLVFIVESGDTLMTEKYLTIMEDIETTIKETAGFEDYCLRSYTDTNGTNDTVYGCSRESTLTNFFDEDYFLPATDESYTLYPSYTNTINFLMGSKFINATAELTNKNYSDEFIDTIVTYWAGYGNGEGPGDYQAKYYDGEQMPGQFYYTAVDDDGNAQNYSVSNVFGSLSSASFAYESPYDTDVEAALTMFSFGLPLKGYTSSSDDTDSQEDEIGEWCYDKFQDMFTDFQKKYEGKIDFYWDCATMGDYYSLAILMKDALLMGLTFSAVYILMIINTGSVWLATCGMAMILMNFLPALLLYGGITQQNYFGTLCVMAMFIILAIGADDIFVIVDTWQQYRTAAPDEPMEKRMTATLKHAGKVMLTTSASTCFSFIGNCTSAFPAVYTFGLFAAWLVFVNYCAVCLFYPTVLAVHDTYFYTPKLKKACCVPQQCAEKPCCTMCCGKFPNVKDEEEDADQERPIDKFCQYKYFPFILKYRNNVLMITALFFLIFLMLAAQIEPDPETPQFYPEGNNYQEYSNALSDNFASETDQQQEVYLVWGIEGIDRDGTEPTDEEDIGEVVYSDYVPNFAMTEDEQLYIAQISDDLLCVYKTYSCRYVDDTYYTLLISDPSEYGDEDVNVLKSPMLHFRTWVEEDNDATPDNETLVETLDYYNLTDAGITWVDFENCTWGVFPVNGSSLCFIFQFYYLWSNDELPTSNPDYTAGTSNYDYWKGHFGFRECEYDEEANTCALGVEMKFIYVKVLTEASVSYNYLDGMDQFDEWQDYGDKWLSNVSGITTQDQYSNEFVGTPMSMSSLMVADLGYFSYYFIQEKIIAEAIIGIGLSLLFAFIILTVATGNWLMAMYSTIVIFSIVMCVIGFTVANGWKLGVIEAVIYVMVVGMSVDYVVHLSEAYLASGKEKREDRTRRMLGIVGSAVLSGALSTMIGIFWLLFATIMIFLKFGSFIFFLVAVSCTFSLVSFTAAMSAIGPEGEKGDIRALILKCKKMMSGEKDVEEDMATQQDHNGVTTTESEPAAQ